MNKTEQAVIELDGEWDKDSTERHVLVRAWREDKGEFRYVFWYPNWEWRAEAETICTYPEFMEVRKRLENKPSWDDAPEWAQWLAQDSDGGWHWYEGKPHRDSFNNDWDSYSRLCRPDDDNVGHVFGDWRQSLEPRPQPDNKEGEGVNTFIDGRSPKRGEIYPYCGDNSGIISDDLILQFIEDRVLSLYENDNGRQGDGNNKAISDVMACLDLARKEFGIKSRRDKVIETARKVFSGSALMTPAAAIEALDKADMLKLPGEEQ